MFHHAFDHWPYLPIKKPYKHPKFVVPQSHLQDHKITVIKFTQVVITKSWTWLGRHRQVKSLWI